MQQKKLIIILADISGYTRFMVENRTSAVHGQLCINSLIESILQQVDIPLTLQEIEGDAVFLYAAHPGSDTDWEAIIEEVSRKLAGFFEAFIAQSGVTIESTPCGCAICRNADKLGLKIIVHAGEAVFHEVAGRAQVSGPDVILAHRLLKNSLQSSEYLLLTEDAYHDLGHHLPGTFETFEEDCEGFGSIGVRVRFLEQDFLAARDAVYQLDETQLRADVENYGAWIRQNMLPAARQQMQNPIRPFSWAQRALMIIDSFFEMISIPFYARWSIPKRQLARGRRRTSWKGRPSEAQEDIDVARQH